jgi:CrcB protein
VLGKPWFPVGTLAVNVIGCYVIGFLGEVVGQRRIFNQELRLFLFVGVLGGFTTFSAFAYETSSMLRDSRLYGAWLNVGLQIVLGLLAVRLGVLSSRWL